MILSKATVWLLCLLLLLSVFMANLLSMIATDHNFFTENDTSGINYAKKLENKYVKITDTTENIIWFLQVGYKLFSLNQTTKKGNVLNLCDVGLNKGCRYNDRLKLFII